MRPAQAPNAEPRMQEYTEVMANKNLAGLLKKKKKKNVLACQAGL